jgi:hypothetical protein
MHTRWGFLGEVGAGHEFNVSDPCIGSVTGLLALPVNGEQVLFDKPLQFVFVSFRPKAYSCPHQNWCRTRFGASHLRSSTLFPLVVGELAFLTCHFPARNLILPVKLNEFFVD